MPSIAAHFALAKLLCNKLNVNKENFYLGSILPDIIADENSHYKEKSKYYLVPNIYTFILNNKYPKDIFLGYLAHLLLDKYFLEEYVPKNIKKFSKIDLFSKDMIYNDYTNMNILLVNKYELDLVFINKVLSINKYSYNEDKYKLNITSINYKNTDKIKYIDIKSFYNFLDTIYIKILEDIRKWSTMLLNIDCCFFVLENIKSENKRKNDSKRLKILVDQNNNLPTTSYEEDNNIKDSIRNKISSIIGSSSFHLEQVYTLGDKRFSNTGISVIYLGITNEENIKDLSKDYKLIDFDIIDNKEILIGDNTLKYETKTRKKNNSLEYYHEIKTASLDLEKQAIELLTSYKHVTSRIDYTDIMFKFLPKYYTLEDVRIVYEKIKNVKVDKSNFRKKIMKYCKPTDKVINDKGYRPTQLYEFVLDENDIWL